MNNTEEKLKEIARRWHISGALAANRILLFSSLNPEQKLAFVLELLVAEGKERLMLLEICKMFTEECKQWKETPEGKAWMEAKQKQTT